MKSWLNKIIDRFVYKGDKENIDTYYKGRFFIIIQSFFFLMSVASLPYYFNNDDISISEELKWLYIFSLLVFASIFIIYPRYGYRVALVNIHSIIAATISMYGTYYEGGGIYSPDLAFTATITIYAFLVANRITGYVWTIVAALQLIFFYYAEINGLQDFRSFTIKLQADYYLFSILFSLVFGVFLIVQFEKTKDKLMSVLKKSQNETENQKQILEYQKNEIISSINYAKQIQYAVLPHEDSIYRSVPLSFIFYKPRDIVSGDFFWFHEIDRDNYIIVCADCTGHGVPGAFMTVIGSNLLTQIVKDNKNYEPAQILSELDTRITDTLKQGKARTANIQDGMDLSLLKVNKASKEFIYTSAKRPAILIRNNEILEFKGSKVSLGGIRSGNKLFEEIRMKYEEDDMIYLFTDGYIDQFGGSENKKYMIKRFREQLLRIHTLPANQQKESLETTINTWIGKNEQTDDMCVIGIRF